MKKLSFILSLVAMFAASVLFVGCKNDDIVDPGTDNPFNEVKAGRGIWKVTGARLAGGTVDMPPCYAVVDPENRVAALIGDFDEDDDSNDVMVEIVRLIVTDKELLLISPYKYEEFLANPNDSCLKTKIPYMGSGDEITLSPRLADFDIDEWGYKGAGIESFNVSVYRCVDLEKEVEETNVTRVPVGPSGKPNWFDKAKEKVKEEFQEKREKGEVDEYMNNIEIDQWANSKGWWYDSWMSKLDDATPVAWVNLPGSHDSGATLEDMELKGMAYVSTAWVQRFRIAEQYKKGARFFDLRVGLPLEETLFSYKVPDLNSINDLNLYHGPLKIDTKFRETVHDLASKITQSKTEFAFINVQAERECTGLVSEANNWLADKLLGIFGDGNTSAKMHDQVLRQSMVAAKKLLGAVNHEFGDTLLIPYTRDLTVGKARGHIIVFLDADDGEIVQTMIDGVYHKEYFNYDNKTITYYDPWPQSGYGSLFYKEIDDTNKNNLFIQSKYEMGTSDFDKMKEKIRLMKELIETISAKNLSDDKQYVLGFNATNANTGNAFLYTHYFANRFNGPLYRHFIDFMKQGKPIRCGIVSMDHYGDPEYSGNKMYGDMLSWAVIESNFYDYNQNK